MPPRLEHVQGLQSDLQSVVSATAAVLSVSADEVHALLEWPVLASLCTATAVVVFVPAMDSPTAHFLLTRGVQDVVLHTHADSLSQRLWLAIGRRRLIDELRTAHATDLRTGLPNRQQLIEHMSQLLALREREPRPASLLVLRIDGLEGVEAVQGPENANVLRRKVAVRLRAGLRASDVVASVGLNEFAVLLPSMESPADVQLVIGKLLRAIHDPFNVAGAPVRLTAAAGAAHFPQDGMQPVALLAQASAQAAVASRSGRAAAND